MRFLLCLLACLPLAACQLVYKLPTRQGNVIEQKELDKLETGMTREQVKFLLGTPIADSPFNGNRWDYTGYYKNPRGKIYNRTVSLHFEEDKLVRMEGIEQAEANGTGVPDLEALEAEEEKKKTEEERAEEDTETGIVITPGN